MRTEFSVHTGGNLRKLSACWVDGQTSRRNHARTSTHQSRDSLARGRYLPRRAAGTHHGLHDRGRRVRQLAKKTDGFADQRRGRHLRRPIWEEVMEWFNQKTSIAGIQVSNWMIALGAIIVILLGYSFMH